MNVQVPARRTVAGYDVVTYTTRNMPDCSPLSCNGLAVHPVPWDAADAR